MLYTSLEEARMTYLTNQMLTANCGSAQFKPKPNVETIYDYFLGAIQARKIPPWFQPTEVS